MQFQVIRDEYYLKVIDRLRTLVPDFQTVFDKDDGIYLIVGEFSDYLINNIDNPEILGKCLDFINEAVNLGKDETKNVIITEIFQPIYRSAPLINKVKPYLSKEAFNMFIKHSNNANH